jgi:hypothetical protein
MARKRGLFSTGTAGAIGSGMQGIFNGAMAAETINSRRAKQAEEARQTDIQRFLAGLKGEELSRPTSVITYGADGKPQINVQQGTNPGRLDALGATIGLPPGAGGVAAPAPPRSFSPPRPLTPPEDPNMRLARDLIKSTFSGQIRYRDVDEQTANSLVNAGNMTGVPISKISIPSGFLGLGKTKFRVSLAAPGGGTSTPATPPAAAPAAKIKVSNGKETLLIDPADEASAAADGYRRI